MTADLSSPIATALVGHPNCGKTTLFNALTGANQRVGNWPGVTVERVVGDCQIGEVCYPICDLPGVCTLDVEHASGLDEQLTLDCLQHRKIGRVIHVVDACHLARHLYLTLQLLERGLPVLVVLTMTDRLKAYQIDVKRLGKQLGVPVIEASADQKQGLTAIKQWLRDDHPTCPSGNGVQYSSEVLTAVAPLEQALVPELDDVAQCQSFCLQWLSSGQISDESFAHLQPWVDEALSKQPRLATLIAQCRHQEARRLFDDCTLPAAHQQSTLTKRIDDWVLNRWLGIPIFLLVMYLTFFAAVNVGGLFEDCFDIVSQSLLVDLPRLGLAHIGAPMWLTSVVSQGIGSGLSTLLTFVPVIAAMYVFLAILESSGYMVRAAFVVDRFMRLFGLSGRAFVPLIVGFGCNVPAVMATRTLDNSRDRIVTALMSPFMACTARLAVFTAFVSVFFPRGGHNVIFLLYLTGILVALLTASLLKEPLGRSYSAPFLMELPDYHRPYVLGLCQQTWSRLKHFISRSGLTIVPFCALFSVLSLLHVGADGVHWRNEGDSVIAAMAKSLTPIFSPMGIDAGNWPATVSLLAGTIAKETTIGTLNTLYGGIQSVALSTAIPHVSLLATLQSGLLSIWHNFLQLPQAILHPLSTHLPGELLDKRAMAGLTAHFHDSQSAVSYLLFILLYMPCISTVAALSQEIGRFWARFSLLWSTLMAYVAGILCYQVSTAQLGWTLLNSVVALLVGCFLVRYAVSAKKVVFEQSLGLCKSSCTVKGCGRRCEALASSMTAKIATEPHLRNNGQIIPSSRATHG